MEQYIKDQVSATLRTVPSSLLRYPFEPKTSAGIGQFLDKTGGKIRGVCRPDPNYRQLTDGGFRWIRHGIPFPFDEKGNVREDYLRFKREAEAYEANGLKVMGITSSAGYFLQAGLDPRLPEHEPRIREIARFLITDLRGLIHGVQITNEIGIPRFGHPLKMREAARFIGIQAEAMAPLKGDIIVGYNTAGPQADQHELLLPWAQHLDYVGLDIYLGCFFQLPNWFWVFDMLLKYLWAYTKKPVMLMEIGYLSGGQPKTKAEKLAVLRSWGAETEKAARRAVQALVARLPQDSQDYIARCASGDWGNYIFGPEFRQHFYRELPRGVRMRGCPHTQEGQAAFYRKLLPRLEKLPFLCGTFLYCHKDDPVCGICGQADCPVETRWGLVTAEGEPKLGYYAVKEYWS